MDIRRDGDCALHLYCRESSTGGSAPHYDVGGPSARGGGAKREGGAAARYPRGVTTGDERAAKNSRLNRAKPKARVRFFSSDRYEAGPRRRAAPNPAKGPVAKLVRKLAPQYRLRPELVLAVVEVESNFDTNALSPKNAQGLMQLIPETARRFGVKNVWDPEQNLRGGMAYLRWLLDHFDGDLKLALAGYNAGEQAVRRHHGVPPYDETRNYVRRVTGRLND